MKLTIARILAVAAKEAKTIRRDSQVVKGIILQPILITLIFGFAVKSELREARFCVYDSDRSALSRALVQKLEATGEVAHPVRVESYDEVDALFRKGDASSAAVVIPRGFARALTAGETTSLQLLLNGADTFTALRFSSLVSDVARRFPDSAAESRRTLRPHESSEPAIVLRRTLRFNPRREDLLFFIPTAPAIFLTQLFLGLACFSIAAERERLTYEHLLAMPLRPAEILAGKALPFIGIGFFMVTVYFGLFGPLVCGIAVRGSVLSLAFATLLFFVDSYLLAALMSALARNSQQATYASVFTVLPSTVISGFLVPASTMPDVIQTASLALPATHYVALLRGIVVRGAPLADLAGSIVGLVAIGAAMLVALLVVFPRRIA